MNLLKIKDNNGKLVYMIDINKILSIEGDDNESCSIMLYTGGDTRFISIEKSIEEVDALINEHIINNEVENIVLKDNV